MKDLLLFIMLFFSVFCIAQTEYPNDETGPYEDMLTPEYYLSANGSDFRSEVNKFIYYAREIRFHHPLENSEGFIPSIYTPAMGQFGAGKGPTRTQQYHPAIDMHVGNDEVDVNIYAAFDGYIATYKDAAKYRDYISLVTEVKDENNNVLGKVRVIYGHVDLLLDEADNIKLDGKFVQKGELISKHLYSGTMGGPHLHFEIRYYRPGEKGNEDFYGSIFPGVPTDFTEPSAGSWEYGFWNPELGYGFAHPENHFGTLSSVKKIQLEENILIYPDPAKGYVNVFNGNFVQEMELYLFPIEGELLKQKLIGGKQIETIDLSSYEKGVYLIKIFDLSGINSSVCKIINI
jgi:Secretion system C-terminal sorting domain/Peptidase family M23